MIRYLDGHHVKFDNATGVSPIPNEFHYIDPKRNIYDNSGHVKRQIPPLSSERLSYFAEKIQNLLEQTYFQRNNWVQMRSIIQSLHKSIDDYAKYLWEKQSALENRRINGPTTEDNLELITIKPNDTAKGHCLNYYQALDKALIASQPYKPIDLIDFAPTERRKRYIWLKNIRVSVPIQLYRLKRKQISFVWKIPDTETIVQNLDVVKEVDQIVATNYISRIARRAEERFKDIVAITHDNALSLFDLAAIDLTDEEYDEQRNNNTVQCIQTFVAGGETITDTLTVHNEILNEKKQSKFEKFWIALQSEIDDYVAVADERRHGTVQCVSPLCTSLRHLIEKTEKKMYQMNPEIDKSELHVPSREWVRRQFIPRNPSSKVAGQYKGRFNLKWTMQSRLLRKSHPDHHYGSKIITFVKNYAQKYVRIHLFR